MSFDTVQCVVRIDGIIAVRSVPVSELIAVMRNTLMLILIVGVMALFGSRMIGVNSQPDMGEMAPDFAVTRNDSTVSLHDLRGKYVLLEFWSSADANSRLKSNEYNMLPITDAGRLKRLSVNFDRSEELFNEIVSRDHLHPEEQYFAGDTNLDKIIQDYGVNQGYNSYLIDPQGKIIAVNPDNDYLSKYFKMRPALSYK